MSFTFEDVEGVMSSVASKYVRVFPRFEKDELIAEAWIRGVKDLDNVKFVKQRTIYGIVDYIRSENGTRRKNNVPIKNNAEDELPELCLSGEDFFTNIDNVEYVNHLMETADLNDMEGVVLYMSFFLGMTNENICTVMEITLKELFEYLKEGRDKMRKIYLRDIANGKM